MLVPEHGTETRFVNLFDPRSRSRAVRLAGTIGDLTAAFRPNLKKTKVGTRLVRMRTGGISVPDELADIIEMTLFRPRQ